MEVLSFRKKRLYDPLRVNFFLVMAFLFFRQRISFRCLFLRCCPSADSILPHKFKKEKGMINAKVCGVHSLEIDTPDGYVLHELIEIILPGPRPARREGVLRTIKYSERTFRL
jgi:hypothetical protein